MDTEPSGTTGGVWVIDKERARTRGGEQPYWEHRGSGMGANQLGVGVGKVGMNHWGTENI